MARRAGPRVRVQESEYGRELIVDETFASLHRPETPATGCVWDAIAAPILALSPERRRRVLLLGFGGGSAARIVRALAPGALIVGVELDAEVIRVAREHLDLDSIGAELHVEDARAFIARDRRRFDLILEDVFIGLGDDVHKPDWLPHPGHDLMMKRLSKGGLLVSNTIDEAGEVASALRRMAPKLIGIEVRDYDNRILAAGDETLDARALRAAVARCAVLGETLPELRFRDWTRRSHARGG